MVLECFHECTLFLMAEQLEPLNCNATPLGNSVRIECADDDVVQFQCRIDDGEVFPCESIYI